MDKDNWQIVFNHFLKQGLPEDFIRHVCITRSDATNILKEIHHVQPNKILEVGTFIGLSTGVIALAIQKDATLVCVDLNLPINLHRFIGSGEYYSHDTTPAFVHVRRMFNQIAPNINFVLIPGFFSTQLSQDILDKLSASKSFEIKKMRIVANEVERHAPFQIIFLDGDHSAEGVASDLKIASQFLSRGGRIILHDVSDNWGKGVNLGIKNFLNQNANFQLNSIVGNIGIISKKENIT